MKMSITTKVIAICLLLITNNTFAQKLNRTEKKILKTITANNSDAIEFLKK